MTVNEVRVGNWMKDINGQYFQISGNDIKIFHELGMMMFRSNPPKPGFEGVALTPAILTNCGFESIDSLNDFKYQDWHLRHWKNNNSWILLNKNGSDLYPRMPIIQYLHQLQNLYLDLTGQELPVKLYVS